jgi:hypothetical protein
MLLLKRLPPMVPARSISSQCKILIVLSKFQMGESQSLCSFISRFSFWLGSVCVGMCDLQIDGCIGDICM